MKKKLSLVPFLTGLITICLLSCPSPLDQESEIGPLGYLEIKTMGSARPLGSAEAQNIQNILTLILLKDQEVLSFSLDWPLQGGHQIGLSPGEYRLGALAGYLDSPSSDIHVLLGCTEAPGIVSITEGEVASITLTLRALSWNFLTVSQAYPGERADFQMSGALPGDFFSIIEGGNGNSIYPSIRLDGPQNSSQRLSLFLESGFWSSQGSLILPLESGEYHWEFQGPRIGITGRDAPLSQDVGEDWRWFTTIGQSEGSPVLSEARQGLSIIPWENGIDVTIGWEEP